MNINLIFQRIGLLKEFIFVTVIFGLVFMFHTLILNILEKNMERILVAYFS